jgi:hypothetical protein
MNGLDSNKKAISSRLMMVEKEESFSKTQQDAQEMMYV